MFQTTLYFKKLYLIIQLTIGFHLMKYGIKMKDFNILQFFKKLLI
jgi:hypothetical protein